MQKDLNYYKSLLPERITVRVEKNEDGSLWASIKEIKYCYTQASNSIELTDMLNDAICTHFDIPRKFKGKVGYYLPMTKQHAQVEDMVRKLISIENQVAAGKDAKETFSLTSNTLCTAA